MRVIEYEGLPAIRIENTSDGGFNVHLLDIDEARQLRDDLTAMIKKCVTLEAVRLNASPSSEKLTDDAH